MYECLLVTRDRVKVWRGENPLEAVNKAVFDGMISHLHTFSVCWSPDGQFWHCFLMTSEHILG